MMPDLGKYAVSVLGSYAAAAVLLGLLVAVTVWRGRQVARALAAAEARARRGRADG